MGEFNIEEILDQLTLGEKIGLLAGIDFWHTFPVSRLGIPSLRFSDGPNGVRGTRFFNSIPSACFPCGTGLAATFNKDLLRRVGKLMGEEARHKGAHVILGPTTNMQRGPLGGRGFESFSEDPHLAGMASASIVNGIQDGDIAATIKHFVCNDLEHERSSSNSIVSERALREIYLEPFRLAIKFANPKAFMTAYNKVNGEHASQSAKLLNDILRREWGWDGTVMSDWFGTYSSKDAIENGLDIEMPGPTRFRNVDLVSHAVISKEISIKDIDSRVRNVLKLIKYAKESGIPENAPETSNNNTSATSKLLKEFSAESIVLLKNENSILPLKKKDKIAVIGPNAKIAAYCGGGSAALRTYYTTTPFDGITKKYGSPPPYTVGAYAHKMLPGLADKLINPVTGEKGFNIKFYKEPPSESERSLFDEVNLDQSSIFLADYKNSKIDSNLFFTDICGDLEVDESGTYEFGLSVYGTAQLFVNDKLVLENNKNQIRGETFFNMGTIELKNKIDLKAGRLYKVRIEFGSSPTYTADVGNAVDFGGGGGVNIGFAKCLDAKAEISRAVSLAKSVEKVVLFIGLNQEWEAEGFDRSHMELPLHTNAMVTAVLDANPNTVIVNQSGTPVEFPWLSKSKALLQAWYGGTELGSAIADVLFGDINPSGKLSLSFPLKLTDNPTYLNFKSEKGRVLYGEDVFMGYRYYEKLQKQVAFPFGYGLSYTKFHFSNLKVKVDEANDNIVVTLSVKNVGKVFGAEVVQVYVAPIHPSVIRPVKELKGFEKIELKPGKSQSVDLNLPLKDSTSFWDEEECKWNMEHGSYEIQVGSSSDDIHARAPFDIKKSKLWIGI